MAEHVVVLGAGFGGLELVTGLSEAIPDKVRITLIDKSDAFMFGFSKLDVMFGRRQASEVWNPYRAINKPGVEFRQETVTAIDPEHRRVVTDVATYEADILVVALGADYDVAATPGLVGRRVRVLLVRRRGASPSTRSLHSRAAPSSWVCSVRSSSAPERRSRPRSSSTTTSRSADCVNRRPFISSVRCPHPFRSRRKRRRR